MKKAGKLSLILFAFVAFAAALSRNGFRAMMGRQRDGSFIVSTGQHIEGDAIAFKGRPIDIAMHPSGRFIAVLSQREVFLCNGEGVLAKTRQPLTGAGEGYSGLIWSTGNRGVTWAPGVPTLFAST